jgi:hypothetical protein
LVVTKAREKARETWNLQLLRFTIELCKLWDSTSQYWVYIAYDRFHTTEISF